MGKCVNEHLIKYFLATEVQKHLLVYFTVCNSVYHEWLYIYVQKQQITKSIKLSEEKI